MYSHISTDCYVSNYVNHILLIYLIYCSCNIDSNKSVDFLLASFCTDVILAMFSVTFYTSKLQLKLKEKIQFLYALMKEFCKDDLFPPLFLYPPLYL